MWPQARLQNQTAWIGIPALPLPTCVTVVRLLLCVKVILRNPLLKPVGSDVLWDPEYFRFQKDNVACTLYCLIPLAGSRAMLPNQTHHYFFSKAYGYTDRHTGGKEVYRESCQRLVQIRLLTSKNDLVFRVLVSPLQVRYTSWERSVRCR